MILSQSEWKVATTSMASTTDISTQKKQVDKVVEEYWDIFSSPTGLPMHFQVNNSIDLTPGAKLPNGPVYQHYML